MDFVVRRGFRREAQTVAQREAAQGRNGGRDGGGGGGRRRRSVGACGGEGAHVKDEGGVDDGEVYGEEGGSGRGELLNRGGC